jgi:thiamine transport system substrate-binding protein
MKCKLLIVFLIVTALLSACSPKGPVTLTVMTHDDFYVSEGVIAGFEQQNNIKVTFLKGGSVSEALNKAILTRDAPLADVFYGVDNTFLSRALDADIYEPYASPLLAHIPGEFKLDAQNRLLPVDHAYTCINYDKAFLAAHSLPVPATLEDLLKPEYEGLFVVENPAISSTGLTFLLATVAHFGDPGYLDYWRALRENGLVVVNDWGTAYWTNFSGSSGHGPQPIVVSYASSPAAEVVSADPPVSTAPTAAMLAPGTCSHQVEFIGILKGTKQRALAEKFVDFMLSIPFQEDMPLQMYVYPVNPEARLPEAFLQWAQVPELPATLPLEDIAANRDKWIADWTAAVLH